MGIGSCLQRTSLLAMSWWVEQTRQIINGFRCTESVVQLIGTGFMIQIPLCSCLVAKKAPRLGWALTSWQHLYAPSAQMVCTEELVEPRIVVVMLIPDIQVLPLRKKEEPEVWLLEGSIPGAGNCRKYWTPQVKNFVQLLDTRDRGGGAIIVHSQLPECPLPYGKHQCCFLERQPLGYS